MPALEAFQQALLEGADDDALDLAAADVRRDSGPAALAEAIQMRIAHELGRGKTDLDVTGLRFRLASALEEVAKTAPDPEAVRAALEATALYRHVLNDGEAATRSLVLALRAAANDDATLKRTVDAAGGRELAEHVVERALKRPEVKEDAVASSRLRRALSRVAEIGGDKERAFFEALKAARKQPGEGLYVDDVFRLALDTNRYTEAAAFFGALADDENLPARQRATLYNKLGQTLEKQGEKRPALEAYTKSVRLHEAKVPKRAVERLAAELGVEAPALPAGMPPLPAPSSFLAEEARAVPQPIAADEQPDVTPVFPRPSAQPATVPEPRAPAEVDITDDEIVASEERVTEEGRRPVPVVTLAAPGEETAPRLEVTGPFPRPISVPPPPPDDGDHDGAVTAEAALEEAAVDAVPPLEDAFVADAMAERLAGAVPPPLVAPPPTVAMPAMAPVRSSDELFPPAMTPFPLFPPTGSGLSTIPMPSVELEAALARLPDRGGESDEPTRRGPTASLVTKQASLEGKTEESVPSKKNKASRKEKKREKTQKKKRPGRSDDRSGEKSGEKSEKSGKVAASPAASATSQPAVSQVDGSPMPAPDAVVGGGAVLAPPLGNPLPSLVPTLVPPSSTTLGPPPGESTERAPAPAATVEAMAPLAMPPMTLPSMEASSALTRAIEALESDDADVCTRAAVDLAYEAPGEARVLRLAARAMSLSAPGGQLPPEAVELFVADAARHGDRAAAMALEIQARLPAATRRAYTHVWLAAAKAAGLDARRVLDLLRDVAVQDAPDGPAFLHAERVLVEVNDVAARDALYLAALRDAKNDDVKAAILMRRLAILEAPLAGPPRHADALQIHATLAVELRSGDAAVLEAARKAHAAHGTPDERARFLAKLARKLPGGEGVDVVTELLDVRMSVDDKIGAEAAAKDLLARRPGDPRTTSILADLLEGDAGRVDELVDILRVGAQQAMSWFGKTAEARMFLERLATAQMKAGRAEEAADAYVQVARLVPDEANLDRALKNLDDVKRHKEAVALLEETAIAVADAGYRARAFLRGAEIARGKLGKRGKARELVERALDVAPRDRPALRAYADLLVEIGDASAALGALERLLVEATDKSERASIHLRMGRLLEEHVLKPDEALTRYRAAASEDPSLKDAWAAMRAIARPRGDRALLVESLRGLAAVEGDPLEKALLFSQVAKVERDERADVIAAERAFLEALTFAPGDEESLAGVAALLAARLQPDTDLDTALGHPNEALLDTLRPLVLAAVVANPGLPLTLRRLEAMALSRGGQRTAALSRFELLLADKPEDLPTLMALARHLAASPRDEAGAEQRRLRCLESILLHHAYSLKPPVHVDVWGEVTALRAATGDTAGARKAARKVMALATTDELKACLSDRAVRAVALALDEPVAPGGARGADTERDPKAIIAALVLDASRSLVEAEKARLLERAAGVAHEELKDRAQARALLEDALRAAPHSQSARDALLDLDLAAGDVAGALKQVRDLLMKEADPHKKAALHLRLFRLRKKIGLDLDGAAAELKAGLELDPGNAELLDAAEQFFTERKDSDGLDKLWSAQLRVVDRNDVRARLKLFERLAQLRRWEKRDLAGAVEALEAMTALDPEAIKPREDTARLYTELGMAREAVNAWRGVLEREPLAAEAWRGIFGRYMATQQGDEAFAVASTMAALDLADDDVARAVRTIRPPFPRWPIPPKDPQLFRKKAAHPLERTPIRAILDVTAPRLLPLYARGLKDFGIRRKDALPEKNVPTSVLMAVRTLGQLLGLDEPPPLFLAELGATEGQSPAFAALPSTEAGIIVTADVLKGGMTPERAFALGRAASWLQPHAVMAAAVDGPGLRLILEGLVAVFLGAKSLEVPDLEAERMGKELHHALVRGLTSAQESALKAELVPALRDYVHARQQVQVADWRAGVGYTGDRVGFLMSTDLGAAFRVIKATSGSGTSIGARLAIKELVLFSVSSAYLALRKDLGLALPEAAAAPLLDIG